MAPQLPIFHVIKIRASNLRDLLIGAKQTIIAIFWCILPIVIPTLVPIGILKDVEDRAMARLIVLFAWRYYRLFVLLFFFWQYAPANLLTPRTVHPKDATVIIPMVSVQDNIDFEECVTTCLVNGPAAVEIVTATKDEAAEVNMRLLRIHKDIQSGTSKFTSGAVDISGVTIRVTYTGVPNKRLQIAHALPHASTRLVVLLDDHVFLKPGFLNSVLLAFENKRVGLCGTTKTVRRNKSAPNSPLQRYWESFWNVMGALYLTRHNFEIRATNTMDGGVFVVSGRAMVILAEIVQDPRFIVEFTNERFFFGIFGPLNPDDDNFITRWVLRHPERYEIKIQCTDDATIETTLGQYPNFLGQCLRWARTTYRSNLCSLVTDRTVWWRWPWTVSTTYIPSLINLALFWDIWIVYTASQTRFYSEQQMIFLSLLLSWIYFIKLVKLMEYFRRHPTDFFLFFFPFPAYHIFAYFHSLLKLWAALTFWNHSWTGRNLGALS
jgi:hypothetical protein